MQYQYKIVHTENQEIRGGESQWGLTEDQLNKMGRDGYRFVQFIPKNDEQAIPKNMIIFEKEIPQIDWPVR